MIPSLTFNYIQYPEYYFKPFSQKTPSETFKTFLWDFIPTLKGCLRAYGWLSLLIIAVCSIYFLNCSYITIQNSISFLFFVIALSFLILAFPIFFMLLAQGFYYFNTLKELKNLGILHIIDSLVCNSKIYYIKTHISEVESIIVSILDSPFARLTLDITDEGKTFTKPTLYPSNSYDMKILVHTKGDNFIKFDFNPIIRSFDLLQTEDFKLISAISHYLIIN